MISFENEIFIREEVYGITVYDLTHDNYIFYKDIKLDDLRLKSKKEVEVFLDENKNLISNDIVFSYPFRLNWLIEKKCNLDCIYCYASDKMNFDDHNVDIQKTIEAIKNLHVLNIGLTGGEPTLNKHLKQIISTLSSQCAIVIDTNAVLPVCKTMLEEFKKANVLIRISLDAVSEKINRQVRPAKNKKIDTFKMINHNIDLFLENNINVLIHTVVTVFNKDYLDDIGEYLIRKNIKKWHLYSVNYCEKCKDIHDKIKVNQEEMVKIYNHLHNKFGKKIEITLEVKSSDYSKCSIGMIDSYGRFFLDTVYDGIKYVGKDCFRPSKEEYQEALNIKGHCQEYLRLNKE